MATFCRKRLATLPLIVALINCYICAIISENDENSESEDQDEEGDPIDDNNSCDACADINTATPDRHTCTHDTAAQW